jgi:isoleucyl-tRNA synthetase
MTKVIIQKILLNLLVPHIFKADDIIINELTNSNSLLGKGKLKHSYPHSWRSKAPLVHRATPQWFISMETNKLRQKSLTGLEIQNSIQLLVKID